MDNAIVKKIDGRSKNGGHANGGRKPALVKRTPITPRVINDTAIFLREETIRLGLSQGEVLDGWAVVIKNNNK